jgi:hypothetical protein
MKGKRLIVERSTSVISLMLPSGDRKSPPARLPGCRRGFLMEPGK